MSSATVRFRVAGIVLFCLTLSAGFNAQNRISPNLVAHEWGTFTSIAGRNGQAVRWLPLRGSAEPPRFVEHFSDAQFKQGLAGTVRMETPVLYFYSPYEAVVSVKVGFSRGVITEWYPHASQVNPDPRKAWDREALFRGHGGGGIEWDSVTVSPNLAARFPGEDRAGDETSYGDSHGGQGNQYYADRRTSASPLAVKTAAGDRQEKILFYRGVSTFSVPISASLSSEGQVRLANLAQNEIPSVLLFERRGDKLGYRLGGALPSEMSLEPPELTGTLESMSRDLEDILTSQGLYPDEAHAMLETWRQSWFEEGSRLFYIVPSRFPNTILPLTIHPAPSQTVRVFVGRLELITPATTQALEKILASRDLTGLQKYDRFLEPILKEMEEANPAAAAQIERDLDATYRSGMLRLQTAK